MKTAEQNVKYPENLSYKERMRRARLTVKYAAPKLGIAVHTLSLLINGHYKGRNITPKLEELLKSEGV